MESLAGNVEVRSGRKSSWGAFFRARFVRAAVLWPRIDVNGSSDWRPVVRSCATGRARQRNSMVICCFGWCEGGGEAPSAGGWEFGDDF